MIRNNFIGQTLIGALVFFLLLSSVQMFGWGQGIGSIKLDKENMASLPAMPTASKATEVNSDEDKKLIMDTIYKRPMFSTTREPFKEALSEVDVNDEESGPVGELKAQLTGVVITPEQSYAMILDTITNERETYKVGMPLEGEQGGWTLDSIQNRKVVFISDDDKTEELELEVYSGSLKAGKAGTASKKGSKEKPNKNESKNVKKGDEGKEDKKDKKKNADDIRKKIAERRAKMRADAAKKQ